MKSESAAATGQAPGPPHPSGTIAFLFSDIEGSTKRWEQHPGAMQEALRRHDALMRAAIGAHNGHVFKTIGDAFCAAFHVVPDAVAAALAAQSAIAADLWSDVGGLTVRMAVHAGVAEQRDGDYFGPTVNRVARLLAIAHGGQLIVSGAAAGLVRGVQTSSVVLRDLGRHRLRDLAHPEQVFQVVAPGLREIFPPLRSIDSLPNNLPLQLTSFVGREHEVDAIKQLVAGARLVTVVGSGGVGKTRASLQVAADLLEDMPDGAWFVDFAPVAEPSLIAGVLATALGVHETGDRPTLEAVVEYLVPRKTLIVLDNCEHVIVEAARVADTFLRNCPHVKLLATSRESLVISGEHVYRMPSLSVPPVGMELQPEDARSYGAVALFADRAAAADSRFVLTSANVQIVADICRRLDGIALALELAAPRVKIFSVRQLADRLDERFRLLTGGSRAALPRQQTMRALIDWSYDLLTEEERSSFRRFGIFFGGWTLEAAGAVCGDDPAADWVALERLSALTDKSLVHVDFESDSQRYRLLESTRQYAREALEKTGEFEAAVRAHCGFFLGVARRVDELFVREGKSDDAFELAKCDLDNLRAALVWSLGDANDTRAGCELAARLSILWSRALRYEGTRWLNAAIACECDDPDIRARIILGLSHVLPDGAEKVRRGQDAVTAYRHIDDPLGLASALSSVAEARRAIGDYDAASDAQAEGVELYRAHGMPAQVAAALLTLGSIETIVGKQQAARRLFEEARRLNPRNGSIATNLAELEFADGHFESAIEYGREALEYFKDRHRFNACIAMCNLAAYALALDRVIDARPYARAGLEAAHVMRVPDLVALAVQHLASVASLSGSPERAARLLGFVDAQYAKLGLRRDTSEQATYERLLRNLQQSFGDDDMRARLAEGAEMTDDQATAEALQA